MKTKPESILDHSVIRVLRDLDQGGTGAVRELVGLFLEIAPKRIAHLKKALAEKDFRGLAREAHSLKASSANLGALRLSRVCRDLEGIENHPAEAPAEKLVNEIEQEFALAAEMLHELVRIVGPSKKISA